MATSDDKTIVIFKHHVKHFPHNKKTTPSKNDNVVFLE
jgi:hypothetical protein